jgi:hypothetical protein
MDSYAAGRHGVVARARDAIEGAVAANGDALDEALNLAFAPRLPRWPVSVPVSTARQFGPPEVCPFCFVVATAKRRLCRAGERRTESMPQAKQ